MGTKTVVICSSMEFIDRIRTWKDLLERNGFQVLTPHMVDHRKSGIEKTEVLELKRRDSLRHFHRIERSDAVLVLNYDRHGVKNYVGGASFGEIAIAKYLKKPVFLANPIPQGMPYTEELEAWGVRIWNGPRPSE